MTTTLRSIRGRPAGRPLLFRALALALLLLAAALPARALQADRELLVERAEGPAILPTFRDGERRLFALGDLLRLQPATARTRGGLWELSREGRVCRVLAGGRFASLPGGLFQLAGPALESPDGPLLDLDLLPELLRAGLFSGELDLAGGRLRLPAPGAALRRDELPGGDLLRLRLPSIPVFESQPGEERVDLLLPAGCGVESLAAVDLAWLGGEGLVRAVELQRRPEGPRLAVSLSEQAELLEVVELEELGEVQLVLRRLGGPVEGSLFADEPLPEVRVPTKTLAFDRIVIDAGHGGKDPGAISPGGRYEKDLVLAVALALRDELKRRAPDLEVVMTRDTDCFLSLGERTALANKVDGQLFVSIHANAAKDRRARGYEVFFLRPGKNQHARQVALRENASLDFEGDGRGAVLPQDWILASMAQSVWAEESQNLAALLATELESAGRRRRRSVQQAGFQVLVGASMPAVLVECGFITNQDDEALLRGAEGRKKLAKELADGLLRFRELYGG